MQWAVGVTTFYPDRICMMLPVTLESLRRGGFQNPRLFVDNCRDPDAYRHFGLEVTLRYPRIMAWGNWWLALNELYIRQPHAARYAIFQDDIQCVRNLRPYLEAAPYPTGGYCNLCLYPQNAESGRKGWYRAPSHKQGWRGYGAQGLVFDRTALLTLIGKDHEPFTLKPTNANRGHEAIDGAVVSKLEAFGIMEHVHAPSLIRHIGDESVIGHGRQPATAQFPGEDFDAMELLP